MAGKNFGRVNVSITASTGGLTAGLSSASKQLQGFRAGAQGMAGTITTALAGFVGLGGGATIAAVGVKALSMAIKTLLAPLLIVTSLVSIFAAFGRSARELDEAGKTARRLGMSMTSFQNMGQVAEEAGVSMGQMGTLLTFMTRNLGNLANGSASAQKAFGRLGLTMADLQGLSPDRQFELISQRIMALPTAAERTAAAMAIFGRQGAMAMGLIADASSGAISEVAKLREQLGLNLTDTQVKGVEMMNDAVGRMSLIFQGFINQFVAELAPAITTVANLFVKFFAENTSGFSIAQSMAQGLTQAIRGVAGGVTLVYGSLQLVAAAFSMIGSVGMNAFGLLLTGVSSIQDGIAVLLDVIGSLGKGLVDMIMIPIKGIMSTVASMAEAVGATDIASGLRVGMDIADGLTEGWEHFGDTVRGSTFLEDAAQDAFREAEVFSTAASDLASQGLQNLSNPFASFDAELGSVTAQMQKAGAAAGAAAGETAGQAIGPAISASTKALKAIVVGTSEGEAFQNSILRGADPRLDGAKDQARTADATEQAADSLQEIESSLAGLNGGLGLATISV